MFKKFSTILFATVFMFLLGSVNDVSAQTVSHGETFLNLTRQYIPDDSVSSESNFSLFGIKGTGRDTKTFVSRSNVVNQEITETEQVSDQEVQEELDTQNTSTSVAHLALPNSALRSSGDTEIIRYGRPVRVSQGNRLTASATQSGVTVSTGVFLLILVMLVLIVILVRITTRKRNEMYMQRVTGRDLPPRRRAYERALYRRRYHRQL